MACFARPGHADIGEAALLLEPLLAAFLHGAGMREQRPPPSPAGRPCRIPAPWRRAGSSATAGRRRSSRPSPSPARRVPGSRPGSRTRPARGRAPSGSPAGRAPRATCPASTCRCSRSPPAGSRRPPHGPRAPGPRASGRSPAAASASAVRVPAGQLVGAAAARAAMHQRDALGAGDLMHPPHRGVAEAALRGVDDPLEGQVVGRLGQTRR